MDNSVISKYLLALCTCLLLLTATTATTAEEMSTSFDRDASEVMASRAGMQAAIQYLDSYAAAMQTAKPDLRLEEVAEPVPGPSDILIKVTAVGLNFFDTLLLRNQYQVTPPLPFSPGAEVAGVIEGLGANVTDFEVGQRVVAFIGGNGCREKIITKAKNAIPIPHGVSDEIAAGIPITYGTALHAFKDRAKLQQGETVAVLGAAGGAGVAAIEVAKLMGARVIAVASSSDTVGRVRRWRMSFSAACVAIRPSQVPNSASPRKSARCSSALRNACWVTSSASCSCRSIRSTSVYTRRSCRLTSCSNAAKSPLRAAGTSSRSVAVMP